MDPDGTVSQYLFDFGDGTNSTWIASPATTHAYASPGTYTVTVMVRDDKGKVSETSASITVTVEMRPTNKGPGFVTLAGAIALATVSAIILGRRRR